MCVRKQNKMAMATSRTLNAISFYSESTPHILPVKLHNRRQKYMEGLQYFDIYQHKRTFYKCDYNEHFTTFYNILTFTNIHEYVTRVTAPLNKMTGDFQVSLKPSVGYKNAPLTGKMASMIRVRKNTKKQLSYHEVVRMHCS